MPQLILFLFLLPVLYRLVRALSSPDQLKAEEARQARNYLLQYFGKPRRSNQLDEIGQQLADAAGVQAQFFVLPSQIVNAVCLPNGDIYVWHGLFKEVSSKPDELAAVLAHEIGHLKHEHFLRSVYWSALIQFSLGILARPLGFWGRSIASSIIKGGYSRFHEWEADAAAVELLQATSHDPMALAKVLNRVPNTKFPGMLRSHPDPIKRVERIRKLVLGDSDLSLDEDETSSSAEAQNIIDQRPIEEDPLPNNVIRFPNEH